MSKRLLVGGNIGCKYFVFLQRLALVFHFVFWALLQEHEPFIFDFTAFQTLQETELRSAGILCMKKYVETYSRYLKKVLVPHDFITKN